MNLQLLRIYGVQLKNNFVREAVYRTNFITMLLVDLVWNCVELALFQVIYANTSTLGGWTRDQTFFFLGVSFASDALFTIFFQRSFWNFSDLVNKGELDLLLTKPVHPLILVFTRWVNFSSFFNFAFGLAICIHYAQPAGFAGGWHWLLLPFWLLLGLSTACLLRFFFSIFVFWTERGNSISRLYYQFYYFATKPDTIYPHALRIFILTVLPFAFIGSVPARALLFGLKPWEYIQVGTVLILFFLLNRFLWNRGLQRYQSASS